MVLAASLVNTQHISVGPLTLPCILKHHNTGKMDADTRDLDGFFQTFANKLGVPIDQVGSYAF